MTVIVIPGASLVMASGSRQICAWWRYWRGPGARRETVSVVSPEKCRPYVHTEEPCTAVAPMLNDAIEVFLTTKRKLPISLTRSRPTSIVAVEIAKYFRLTCHTRCRRRFRMAARPAPAPAHPPAPEPEPCEEVGDALKRDAPAAKVP